MRLRRLFYGFGMLAFAAPAFAAVTEHRSSCDDLVIIAPPPVDDWRLGSWIADEAGRDLVKAEKRCWSVRKFEWSQENFDIVGSTTAFPRAPDTLGPRQIRYLAERLSATHILFVDAPSEIGCVRGFFRQRKKKSSFWSAAISSI